jgi:hypothetical protein
MNKSIRIRDLQKVTAAKLEALEMPTPVKSGERTVGAFFPLKKTDPKKLKALLLEIEKMNRGRDVAADDRALEQFGPVDKTDWSFAAARANKRVRRKK